MKRATKSTVVYRVPAAQADDVLGDCNEAAADGEDTDYVRGVADTLMWLLGHRSSAPDIRGD